MHRTFILALGILTLPCGLRAASSTATEKEYQQVRAIAMRDARVLAAYRDADRKLDAKIIQIDPVLESYVKSRQAAREGTAQPTKPVTKPFAKAKATPTPAPATKQPSKAAAKTAPATSAGTHTVASGETLSAIATKYHVTVAALKSANKIQDERKLRVGQVLTIPGGKAQAAAEKKEGSAWSRLMH